jgi:glycosyltransferase involved in cell wall biosynthesis
MGGIETHVNEVGRRLVAAGHRVTVLTTDRSGERVEREVVGGMEIRRVRAYPKNHDLYLAPAIWREVISSDADLIHIQGYHTFVPPLAMMAARRKGLPYVITFHSGGHSSPLRNLVRGAQWKILAPLVRRASGWIGVSRFEAEQFSAAMGLPRDRMRVVPNGAGMPVLAGARPVGSATPTFVSIGRLERYKGHHRAIEAMPALLKVMPGARLRVLGEGPYRPDLEALVKRLNLGHAVTIGAVPPGQRAELAAILKSAAAVVLLSDYEAHPVAVLEALALGCPVLTSDTSGFREMAEAGMVRTIPLTSVPQEVAREMIRTLSIEKAAKPITLPTWEGCAYQLEAIYREVVAA